MTNLLNVFQEKFKTLSNLHVVVSVLFLSTAYVTFCNLVFADGALLHVSDYTVSLFGKYLCYALLALAVDLVWGYCGVLSLGHGAFFTPWACILCVKLVTGVFMAIPTFQISWFFSIGQKFLGIGQEVAVQFGWL